MDENIITKEVKEQLINTFEEVKEIVRKSENRSRAGLMLGIQELGSSLNGYAVIKCASKLFLNN